MVGINRFAPRDATMLHCALISLPVAQLGWVYREGKRGCCGRVVGRDGEIDPFSLQDAAMSHRALSSSLVAQQLHCLPWNAPTPRAS